MGNWEITFIPFSHFLIFSFSHFLIFSFSSPYIPNKAETPLDTAQSTPKKKSDIKKVTTRIISIAAQVSFFVGHVTLEPSCFTSLTNFAGDAINLLRKLRNWEIGNMGNWEFNPILIFLFSHFLTFQIRKANLSGRGGGSRTPSLRFWRPTLYQLSYTPVPKSWESGDSRPHLISITYSIILLTTPAPTVRPPSRIAKRKPSDIAMLEPRVTVILILSPGITISVPEGSSTAPVTSVVRK